MKREQLWRPSCSKGQEGQGPHRLPKPVLCPSSGGPTPHQPFSTGCGRTGSDSVLQEWPEPSTQHWLLLAPEWSSASRGIQHSLLLPVASSTDAGLYHYRMQAGPSTSGPSLFTVLTDLCELAWILVTSHCVGSSH